MRLLCIVGCTIVCLLLVASCTTIALDKQVSKCLDVGKNPVYYVGKGGEVTFYCSR
jgi:hypothetical protein